MLLKVLTKNAFSLNGLLALTAIATAISTAACSPSRPAEQPGSAGDQQTLASNPPSHPTAGPGSSSGGDFQGSTAAQVKQAVQMAAFNAPVILDAGAYWQFTDAKAREIAQAIREKVFSRNDRGILGDRFYSLEQQCLDVDGKPHSGGAVVGDASQPFCLSMPELQRIPQKELFKLLIPLMGHELAHQAGYGEEDARHFQAIVHQRTQDYLDKMPIQLAIEDTLALTAETLELVRKNASRESICASAGYVASSVRSIIDLGLRAYFPSAEPGEEQKKQTEEIMALMSIRTIDARGYCGLPRRDHRMVFGEKWEEAAAHIPSPIAQGDAPALAKALQDLTEQLKTASASLGFNLDFPKQD